MSAIRIRTYQPDDLPAIARLTFESIERLRWQWAAPQFQPETDCFVAVTASDDVVGVGYFTLKQQENRGWCGGGIHPAYRHNGIGGRLLQALERQLRVRRPDADDAALLFHIANEDLLTTNLLYKNDFDVVRSSYSLLVNLGERHETPPDLPEGITLRPFDLERDWRAVYTADRAAFRDHWGFDLITPEEWRHEHIDRSDFDAGRWLLACAGETIAGLCLNYPGDGKTGHLDTMGVASDWRRRGLGAALVRQSLYQFQQQGYTAVRLGVDAGNTAAVRLYRRLGFYITESGSVYRKTLPTLI
ncbi:MAG: GNAT family N-acetyltransferase [Anaerolineae bacterium]|nr:GNAT family N-acetyltransferase [Anaerolineae bacterium]